MIEALEHTLDPALEAEFALLGSLIYAPDYVATVEGLVTVEHFVDETNAELYRLIVEAVGAGVTPWPQYLAGKMGPWRPFEERGGLRWIGSLVADAPPGANARDFAMLVREGWQRRRVAKISIELADLAARRTDLPLEQMIQEFERELLDVQVASTGARLVTTEEAVDSTLEELENPAISHGVELGIPALDNAIGGVQPGELWLLPARPSMGKSALASSGSLHVARHGVHPDGRRLGAIEINAEMTVKQMTRRHLTDWCFELSPRDAPAYSAIRKRKLTDENLRLLRHVSTLLRPLRTLRMVKKTGITLSTLRGLIRRQVAQWDREGIALGLVTIDHAGLVRPDKDTRGRYEAQTEVAIALKEMADELAVPMLVLVQLSRQIEQRDDKRPMLSDMRDSGAWEENADGVVALYRDAYYAQREPKPTKPHEVALWEERKESKTIEALLLKVREGEAGKVELWGDMPRNAIRGSRPDLLYGDTGFVPPLGLAGAAEDARPPPSEMPTTADYEDDGRPEPPLESYDPGEFS